MHWLFALPVDWMRTLEAILHFKLFSIEDQAVTPQQLLIIVFTLIVTAFVARWARALLQGYFFRHLPVEAGAQYALTRLTQYVIWVVGVLVGLKLLHLNLTAIAVVFGALGVGIGFGLQSIVGNFVAGLALLFERPIRIGDRITMENVEGNITAINFRSTTVLTNDNISLIVPNSQFMNSTVINWSLGDPRVRIHVPVGVAYGSDVDKVTRTLLRAGRETAGVLAEPAPEVRFLEFGDSSLNFELLVWTDQPARHYELRSQLNYAIDAGFRREGIQIPFPQRDLHIKSADALKGLLPRS